MKPVGILLGGGITYRGKLTSECKLRADVALHLYQKGTIDSIILSGLAQWRTPKRTEAEIYAEYLVDSGVKASDLFLEQESRDTIGNAIYSKQLALEKKLGMNYIIITSDYHLKRSLYIFGYIFGNHYEISGAPAHTELLPTARRRLKEPLSFMMVRQLLKNCEKGDHHCIEKQVKKQLPMYRFQNTRS
jgi:uncharacterized SAM-binding protein YcdF (DUF218 family)